MRRVISAFILILIVLGALPVLAGQADAKRNAGFWNEWRALQGSSDWKSLQKATAIVRPNADRKSLRTDEEKDLDDWLAKARPAKPRPAKKMTTEEVAAARKKEQELAAWLASEELPPLPKSVLDTKSAEIYEVPDQDLQDVIDLLEGRKTVAGGNGKEGTKPSESRAPAAGAVIDKGAEYQKILDDIAEVLRDDPKAEGFVEVAAYIRGMKAAQFVVDHGPPGSPSQKAEYILDALSVGAGDWKASIHFLEGMRKVSPDNPDILKALEYTRGIQAHEKNNKKKAAIDKAVVDVSIEDVSQAAKFLADVNTKNVKGAEGAIATVINMRTRPAVRAKSQERVPPAQRGSVRKMVERIPPGRYFSNFQSAQQGPRGSAPQGYDPPTSSFAGGCIAR
jgi:hypothetical protein